MTKISILLVDDDRDFLDSFASILEIEGYNVIKTTNGKEALTEIHQHFPHMIILDLMIAGMNGYELCRTIQEDIMTKHLPIIMISGKADIQNEIASLQAGIDDYYVKPFNPEKLLAKIKVIIDHTYRGLDANPLSRLPGNNATIDAIQQKIHAQNPFAFCYLDLDNFKAFNDHYGFERGDHAIIFTAKIIIDSVRQFGEKEDFVGHIGGDDFIIITSPKQVEPICQHILTSFDQIIPTLYNKEDIERNYIIGKNRHGEKEEYPVMTISIGVVTNQFRQFEHLGEISQIAAEVKEQAKRFLGSTYYIDRRAKEEKEVHKSSIKIKKKKILIIDDDSGVSRLLSTILKNEGYEVRVASDGSCAIELTEKHFYNVILVDIKLPDINGLDLLRRIRARDKLTVAIITTGYASFEDAVKSLREHAYDILVKPIDIDNLLLTIKRGIDEQELILHNQRLITTLRNKSVELKTNLDELSMIGKNIQMLTLGTMSSFADTVEAKHLYTDGHSKRVTQMSLHIAKEMNLPDNEIEKIKQACLLHDLGKVGIPDAILLKDGKLTLEEWQKIKNHPCCSISLLKQLDFLNDTLPIIEHHHEKYDGSGYPGGLKGEEIPLGSRIMAVSDAFDAMISKRPYRESKSIKESIKELKDNAGTQFDPKVIDICLKILEKT